MNWYQFKGHLLWPYLTFQRFRYRKASKLDKAILEANRYSRAFSQFAQANIDSALLVKSLDLAPGAVVMDVGGFYGDWTAAVRELFDVEVHVYEPMPDAIRRLESRFGADQQITIHAVALADKDGVETLSLLGPGSSMIRSNARPTEKSVQIELQDTKKAFEHFGQSTVDFFKINIEGAEYQVLQRMIDCGLHLRCQRLMIQYHEFAPNAHRLRRELNQRLAKTHRSVWSYDFVWECWEKRT